MSKKHALLSASAAKRWMHCTPSAKLESKVKVTSSAYADEGTTAHSLAEIMLQNEFDLISNLEYHKLMHEIIDDPYYDDAMSEYISDYVAFIVGLYNGYQSAAVLLEQRYDLSEWIPFGFGHCDVTIHAKTILHIVDLKYGKGVPVYAPNNEQMMLYALGAVRELEFISQVKTVKMTIYQPRIDNISTWQIELEDLLDWADGELRNKADMAFKGEGNLEAGEWCKFCRVKATCKAFAQSQLDLTKLTFADLDEVEYALENDPRKIDDDTIAKIIKNASLFKSWLQGIEDYALKKAFNESKVWPGLKLVHGRSIRKYTDKQAIVELLTKKGFNKEDITSTSLLAITHLEKAIGKKTMTELLEGYIIKPEGRPSLVPSTDSRPAFDKTAEARNEFKEFIDFEEHEDE